MKKIAIYGKGGIGKSTTVSNVSAALSKLGYRVFQIGCDPKADSTKTLTNGEQISTVLDAIRDKDTVEIEDIVIESSTGVYCIEAGGPIPGTGCAGRGIITAFELLEELEVYEKYKPDIVIYDVLGDVVCGGFSMPMRAGYADEVCVVTSGEMMSLYAANNISYAVSKFSSRGYAKMKGLILNSKNIENELEIVKEASREMDTEIIHVLDRNPIVQESENMGKTVIEAFPYSKMAISYMTLAKKIIGE